MKQSILKLETWTDGSSENKYRTIIKTRHGRTIFLSMEIKDGYCCITSCFYTDRNRHKTGADRYNSKPEKLKKMQFSMEEILSVIEAELDKKFYDVEFIQTAQSCLTLEEYLKFKFEDSHKKYSFLIMVGDGEVCNGLPKFLRTRLKNKLHWSIYIELAHYKDEMGVVKQCYYYDRGYKRKNVKIVPPTLTSCFFPYTREGILNLINYEICCDFTHMLITDSIDLDSNTTPLCGAL